MAIKIGINGFGRIGRIVFRAAQHLASDAIDEIVVTDTVPLSPEMKALGKVRVLTLSTMLAEAIRRISNEESISAMFE